MTRIANRDQISFRTLKSDRLTYAHTVDPYGEVVLSVILKRLVVIDTHLILRVAILRYTYVVRYLRRHFWLVVQLHYGKASRSIRHTAVVVHCIHFVSAFRKATLGSAERYGILTREYRLRVDHRIALVQLIGSTRLHAFEFYYSTIVAAVVERRCRSSHLRRLGLYIYRCSVNVHIATTRHTRRTRFEVVRYRLITCRHSTKVYLRIAIAARLRTSLRHVAVRIDGIDYIGNAALYRSFQLYRSLTRIAVYQFVLYREAIDIGLRNHGHGVSTLSSCLTAAFAHCAYGVRPALGHLEGVGSVRHFCVVFPKSVGSVRVVVGHFYGIARGKVGTHLARLFQGHIWRLAIVNVERARHRLTIDARRYGVSTRLRHCIEIKCTA